MSKRNRSLVYSSEGGRLCDGCGRPVAECGCRKSPVRTPTGGGIRVGRETKGRKGKGVTVVTGLSLSETELAQLAKTLKNQCGAGGTVRDGNIEIQGDHRDKVVDLLQARGLAAKRSGG